MLFRKKFFVFALSWKKKYFGTQTVKKEKFSVFLSEENKNKILRKKKKKQPPPTRPQKIKWLVPKQILLWTYFAYQYQSISIDY